MSTTQPDDVHAPYVQELVEADDWAGLVRYWMAHQYEVALDGAFAIVSSAATREGGRWGVLAELLASVRQQPISFERELPEQLQDGWPEAEQMTLFLVDLYPRLALCEIADQAPVEMQEALLRTGIEAGGQACRLATLIRDQAASGFFRDVLARGFRELRQLEAARDSFQEALTIRRELARQRPDVYRPDVAGTLNNLGNVQRDLNDLEAARDSFQQALTIRRDLARQRPDVYRPDVAMTLNNLGNVQSNLNDLEAARDSFQEALTIRRELARQRPDVYRPLVAGTLNNLGNVQRDLNDLEVARDSYQEALTIRRDLARQRPDVCPDVAMTLNNLGNVQRDLNDLEAARDSFQEALTIRRELARQRPDVYRPDVAMTLNNLGNVQRNLNDLEAARDSFQQALTIRRDLARQRPDVYRPVVAMTLNNLGVVQSNLNDLEAARDSFQEALTIHRELAWQRPDVYRPLVAGTLNNLGNVQRDLNNLEAARDSFQEALTIYRDLARQRPDVYRPDVAMTLNNLGSVQRNLNDLEVARDSFQEALTIRRELARRRPDVYRPDVAMTLNNLGVVQRNLNDLEAARDSFQEALTIRRDLARQRPDVYCPDVAMTLNNLGNVQRDLNDLEAARDSFQEALTIRRELARQRPDVYRPDVAMTLNNLGNVQSDLNDLEAARDSLQETLTIRRELARRRPDVYRPDVAMTLNNLGNVQRDINDLEAARDSFQEALTIRRELVWQRPDVYRPLVAMTLNNLGNVQRDLNDLEAARDSFQEALTIYRDLARQRPDVYRPLVAATLNNLGNVQRDLNDLEAARDSYQEALTIYRDLARQRPDVYRPDVAMTLNNLGTLQSDLNDLEAARDSYREAARFYDENAATRTTALLVERQRCWTNLARLYLRESAPLGWPDRREARNALRQAHACAESFRLRFADPNEKRRVQGGALHVSELLVETNVDMARLHGEPQALEEAVEVAEGSRARNLLDLLADETLQPASAPTDLVDAFRQLRRRLQQIERRRRDAETQSDATAEVNAPARPGTRQRGVGGVSAVAVPVAPAPVPCITRLQDLEQEFERVQQEYQTCLRRIQTEHDPDFNPDQPVRPVTFAEIRQLVPSDGQTAFVQYTLTRQRGLALIVTTDDVQAVALPELNDRQAWALAGAWYEGYYRRHVQPNTKDSLSGTAPGWEETVPDLLRPVVERAVRPVVEALRDRGIRRLVLVPNRALHVFPLHACTLPDGRCLTDAFEVVYTPSLSILHRCARRQRPAPSRLLLAQNPTGDLPFTEVEGAVLRRLYPEHTLLQRQQVTRERLLTDADCPVFHYTGHASFDPGDPLLSALILGDSTQRDRWLTLRDVFTRLHLRNNVLTIISGCESGMVKPDRVDDYVGLPSGFLFAGATCVLCTLWAVYDISSALLMQRFHRLWQAGHGIGAALREAQRWLREIVSGVHLRDAILPDLMQGLNAEQRERCRLQGEAFAVRYPDRPPFASPVHWAPFVATGLAYSINEQPRA